jgi:hypothetical protein
MLGGKEKRKQGRSSGPWALCVMEEGVGSGHHLLPCHTQRLCECFVLLSSRLGFMDLWGKTTECGF